MNLIESLNMPHLHTQFPSSKILSLSVTARFHRRTVVAWSCSARDTAAPSTRPRPMSCRSASTRGSIRGGQQTQASSQKLFLRLTLSVAPNVDVEIVSISHTSQQTIPDDPSRSIFWGHTLEEVYNKKMGTFKPEEPVSDEVSAVGLRMTGSPLSMILYSKERIQSSYRRCFR